MARYYFKADSDFPFGKVASFDPSASRPHEADGAPRPTAQIVSDVKADPVERNRAIARLPFSWVT